MKPLRSRIAALALLAMLLAACCPPGIGGPRSDVGAVAQAPLPAGANDPAGSFTQTR